MIRLSVFYGYPPSFSTPQQFQAIDKAKASSRDCMSQAFAAKLEIRETTCMFQSQLDMSEDPDAYFTKVMMFDRIFDQISSKYHQHCTSDLELTLDSSRLYLYAFAFMTCAPTGSATAMRASAQHYLILQKALAAASRLIANLTNLSQSSSPSATSVGLLSFYPRHYFEMLFFAAIFLFRILINGQGALSHNRAEMISSLQAAHKIFQSFPQHRDHTRAAINIELFVKILRDGRSVGRKRLDSLVITNRLGASIMYDSIFRCGEERNSQQSGGVPSDVGSWKTMTEQFPDRLPDVPRRPSAPSNSSILTPVAGPISEGNPEWWKSWDAYIGDFGVGFESLALEMEGPVLWQDSGDLDLLL